jgi:hypothetical protein
MPDLLPDPAILACFTTFEAAVRRVAIELVREVLARELAADAALAPAGPPLKGFAASAPPRRGRRGKTPQTATTRAARKDRGPAAAAPAAAAPAAGSAALSPTMAGSPAPSAPPPPPSAPPPPPNGSAPPGDDYRDDSPGDASRREWSRTRVVTELADWLLQEPTIDAATLKRRGHGALASWALRVFGRFDAALNAANLHLAEKYPEGPPKRGVRGPLAAA